MRAVAMTLDGVLRKPLDREAKDVGGALLFASLVDNFRVVVLGTENPERDEHFLMINGLLRYVKIAPLRPEDGEHEFTRRKAQVQRLRAEGFQFEFVVVPDPRLATELIREGFTTLLYTHPAYTAPSFRPDREQGIRSWSDLSREVDFQVRARAEALKEMQSQ